MDRQKTYFIVDNSYTDATQIIKNVVEDLYSDIREHRITPAPTKICGLK